MASLKTFFSWTDDEVQLLLNVTLDYKTTVSGQGVDWESVQTKYGDILGRFLDHYPSPEDARASGKDFPHAKEEISKAQVTSKLKAIRAKYRRAVDAGRRSGCGQVVLFFELCEAIWGGSTGTCSLPGGIETADLRADRPSEATSSTSSSTTEGGTDCDEDEVGSQVLSGQTVARRRTQLATMMESHRTDRLKRKISPLVIAQEELELKRRMFQRLEETDREFIGAMNRMAASVEMLVQHMISGSSHRRLQSPQHSTPHHASLHYSTPRHGTSYYSDTQDSMPYPSYGHL
ncbi:uncharacterized protein LOC132899880 [Neoarius graeffei]|uniref:uncharacterized protein LOC132899880 n=1 Tax=Neoarius graeffei TaxID=443677 RepID=UPI00298CBECD|nr:uncharacterized protein LOC132899880 [Neoarius graeffei]